MPRNLNLELETDWPVGFQLKFKHTGSVLVVVVSERVNEGVSEWVSE